MPRSKEIPRNRFSVVNYSYSSEIGQSCTKSLFQPKIKDDKLNKCLPDLREKNKKRFWAISCVGGRRKLSEYMKEKSKLKLFKALATIPASLLSPESEGTNNISEIQWRRPGLICPVSIMQTVSGTSNRPRSHVAA